MLKGADSRTLAQLRLRKEEPFQMNFRIYGPEWVCGEGGWGTGREGGGHGGEVKVELELKLAGNLGWSRRPCREHARSFPCPYKNMLGKVALQERYYQT